MKQRLVLSGLAVTVLASIVVLSTSASAASPVCSTTDVLCYQPSAEVLIQKISSVKEPSIAVPAWLGGQ